jgi:hypothetical protein
MDKDLNMSKVQVKVGQIWHIAKYNCNNRYKITRIAKDRNNTTMAYGIPLDSSYEEIGCEGNFGHLDADNFPYCWETGWDLEKEAIFNKDQACDICKKPSPHTEPNLKDNKYICIGCSIELELKDA